MPRSVSPALADDYGPGRRAFMVCKSGADDLDGIRALNPRDAFLDVVFDILGEIRTMPRELAY